MFDAAHDSQSSRILRLAAWSLLAFGAAAFLALAIVKGGRSFLPVPHAMLLACLVVSTFLAFRSMFFIVRDYRYVTAWARAAGGAMTLLASLALAVILVIYTYRLE